MEFNVNFMGGTCGYMVIIGFTEYWPTEGTFEITLDYSLEETGTRENYFDFDSTIYKYLTTDQIDLFPLITRYWQIFLIVSILTIYYVPLFSWSLFVQFVYSNFPAAYAVVFALTTLNPLFDDPNQNEWKLPNDSGDEEDEGFYYTD